MCDEKFPLSEYLVQGETAVGAPASLSEDPYVDIAPASLDTVARNTETAIEVLGEKRAIVQCWCTLLDTSESMADLR